MQRGRRCFRTASSCTTDRRLDVKHARHTVAERRAIVERQRHFARRDRLWEIEPRCSSLVDLRPFRRDRLSGDDRFRLRHVEVAAVEVKRPRRPVQSDVDLVMAREAFGLGKDREVEPVGLRSRHIRKLALGRLGVGNDGRLRQRRARQQQGKSQGNHTHERLRVSSHGVL